MFLHLCFIEKISPCFYMRDLEHRRYIEGVVCLMYRYVGSSKRKRSRMEKQELIFLKPKAAKSLLTFALNVI